MELRHLRYFVAVAEELHFGRAAARLHIAQPPLSRQIRDLEREVGTALFERVPRGVALTPAGRAFLPEARLTLAQAARAQRTAERAARGEIGRLRVGFVEAATYSRVLPEVLGFFRLHLPNIGISLFEMDAHQQADAFRDGRIDVGILHSVPPDADRLLHVEPVYADPMIAAIPQTHRLVDQPRLALGAFAAEALVLFPRPSAPRLYDDIIASCRAAGFHPRIVQEATAWHTLASLVGAGVGLAFVPKSLTSFQRPGVVYRAVRALAVGMEMSAVWKRGDKSPVRERFVTALRAMARASVAPSEPHRAASRRTHR